MKHLKEYQTKQDRKRIIKYIKKDKRKKDQTMKQLSYEELNDLLYHVSSIEGFELETIAHDMKELDDFISESERDQMLSKKDLNNDMFRFNKHGVIECLSKEEYYQELKSKRHAIIKEAKRLNVL